MITPTGFYSAVEDRKDPDTIVVRARVRADLKRLKAYIPGLTIIDNEGTDYPYRTRVSRSAWSLALARMGQEVDYTNFKDAVEARQGRARHDIYLGVWSRLVSLSSLGKRRRKRGGHYDYVQPGLYDTFDWGDARWADAVEDRDILSSG